MDNQNPVQEPQTNSAPPENTNTTPEQVMQPVMPEQPAPQVAEVPVQPTVVAPSAEPVTPQQVVPSNSDIPAQPPMPSATAMATPTPAPQATIGGTMEGTPTQESTKNYVVALILSYLVGSLGVDRFYVGKIGTGILKLISFGGFGIWWLIDFLRIGLGKFKDKKGLPLAGVDTAGHIGKPITIVLVIVNLIFLVPITLAIVFVAMGNVQTAARDAARQNDINGLVAELNTVYATYGAYPALEELNDEAWRNQVAPDITADMLSDPNAENQTNPVLAATPNANVYSYTAVGFDGKPCVAGDGCASYTLTYVQEVDGSEKTYSSTEN